ncbi:probable ATP-dependent DNA helicase HFM1 [Engraulis encrasicolus]|uniref:probable ATP-dependent DNA helicase HFM1 n=1 Tax=Engraulis encrasicolus TaxID=184585 RepID=UPI002FD69F32
MLRSVTEIPAKFRSVFNQFPYFNNVQSKALDDILYTNKNFVVSAPTGSGKTVIFELAIIRLLMESAEPWQNVKVVYMAPIKALCSQQFENWKQKFGSLGLNCKELTGDTEVDDVFEIKNSHIILTTPEKWDSMTRKWKDSFILHMIQLFLIDEVHVLKDTQRGATLEAVISRMKTMNISAFEDESQSTQTRFVAVSATIPNVSDIACWLSDHEGPAACLKMDESHRPVQLRKVVLGFPCSTNQTEFKFDLSLNYKMANIIQTYSDQKPSLVFCSTRKGVQQSADVLAKDARFIMTVDHKLRLTKYADSLMDSKLRDLVMHGVAYHHAGVDASDRKVIEEAFTKGDLPVLFTTSTLAMGVNLPAHLVVIKSTAHYVQGACEDYSEADILQMIGRAGRPQFDTSATAVIMTKSQTKDKYSRFLSGAETIESSLHSNLLEHLNAEIVLHTISDVNMALDWIRSTFLYIRAMKNPKHYGFPSELNKMDIEARLQDLCLKNLKALSDTGLITMDEDINIKSTEKGRLMTRYSVAYDTIQLFTSVSGLESLTDLVSMISKSQEFRDIQLRVNEKRTLNTLNKDKHRTTIRFPMEGKIKNTEMKVSCLIQAQLGCLSVQDFGLSQDTGKIFKNGVRVSKCLAEFLSHHPRNNFSALMNAVTLAKCFRAKLWENSPYIARQLDKIGVHLATAMVNAGLTTFGKIEQTNARELELIVNRHPPFGNQIRESVLALPKYELHLEQLPVYSNAGADVSVTVSMTNFGQMSANNASMGGHHVNLIIGDCDNNVVFYQTLFDSAFLKSGTWSRKISITRAAKGDDISMSLISSKYVGLDIHQKFTTFYSGKPFGDENCGQEVEVAAVSWKGSSNVNVNKSNSAAVSKKPIGQATARTKKGNSTNPSDEAKAGAQVGLKRTERPASHFSSYLRELVSRNESLMETPVKRLKMRMNLGNDTARAGQCIPPDVSRSDQKHSDMASPIFDFSDGTHAGRNIFHPELYQIHQTSESPPTGITKGNFVNMTPRSDRRPGYSAMASPFADLSDGLYTGRNIFHPGHYQSQGQTPGHPTTGTANGIFGNTRPRAAPVKAWQHQSTECEERYSEDILPLTSPMNRMGNVSQTTPKNILNKITEQRSSASFPGAVGHIESEDFGGIFDGLF